ncbi:hypothetical protein DFJ63DRAFT_334716 [Scheffersomyces coipomensis]|uniref:uncharacterized protein n=1 Tax=Scheffersomyces coipomensis TaxID=1788519 RepID=UPI00315D0D8E
MEGGVFGDARYLAEFVGHYLFELPTNVFLRIVDCLPSSYIFDYFLQLPKNNDILVLILEWYFNHTEVTFKLDSQAIKSTDLADVCTVNKIEHMIQLVELPAFYPKQLTIFSRGLQFTDIKSLMERLEPTIASYPYLKLVVEDIKKYNNSLLPDYEFSKDDLRFLLSFPNVKSLSLRCLEAKTPKKRAIVSVSDLLNIEEFSNYKNLEEFVSINNGLERWGTISFPDTISSLTINSTLIDASSLTIPESVTKLNLSKCNITDEILRDITLPNSLVFLDLSFNELTTLPFAELPSTLEEVQFGSNYVIKDIVMPKDGKWLPKLKALILTQCGIHDELLVKLCSHTWPSELIHLKLTWNLMEDITPLTSLPDSLQILDLASHNPLKINDPTNFKFPEALELLVINLQPFQGHLKFPPRMKDSRLSSRDNNIDNFEIPSSLYKLYTLSVKVGSLSKFDWDEFKNLEELSLTNCGIDTIESWTPPPNLKSLSLIANPIEQITSKAPLFRKEFHKLKTISFFSCHIVHFDEDIELPANLTSLDISFNRIQVWNFPQESFKRVRFNLVGNPFTDTVGNGHGLFVRR